DPGPPSQRLLEAAPSVVALPHTTLTGYAVSGRTLRAVRASMMEGRPTDRFGVRHHALTTWRFQPKFTRRNGECAPQSADVEYSVTMTLPDFETRSQLSRAEKARWDQYFAALVAHEINHVRIVETGAERIRQAMRSAVGCDAIQQAARTEIAEVSAASVEYDRLSRHGIAEGAAF
ncbi:MAG: DUF922 domain-containing protein, partial [Candidatus Aminicenantales bacterium]